MAVILYSITCDPQSLIIRSQCGRSYDLPFGVLEVGYNAML